MKDSIAINPPFVYELNFVKRNPSIDCIHQLEIADLWEKIWLHDGDFHGNALFVKLKQNRIENSIIDLKNTSPLDGPMGLPFLRKPIQ